MVLRIILGLFPNHGKEVIRNVDHMALVVDGMQPGTHDPYELARAVLIYVLLLHASYYM